MCPGLTLRRLEITRVNNFDVDILTGNMMSPTGLKSFVKAFVMKSINTILNKFLFKAAQIMLDDIRLDKRELGGYNDLFGVVCQDS